jgi:hypothetical protein
MKTLLTLFLLISAFQICFGQELKEGEFWDSFWGERQSIWEYKNFSKEDVIKSRQKLTLIKQSLSEIEWTGQYLSNTSLGESFLFWNNHNGFVEYYFYHTLKSLSYGNAIDKDGFVIFKDENVNSLKPPKSTVFVKVKFGETHYLIPENKLKDFLEMAVGVYAGLTDNYFSWQKTLDIKKEVFGIPQVPAKFKHLLPSPIKTKIAGIGKKTLNSETEEIYRFVILGDGKNKKIKVGMNFFVEDLGEWVEIVNVSANSSIGKITRSFYDKIEECRTAEKGQGEGFPCKKIEKNMKVTTRRSEYFF